MFNTHVRDNLNWFQPDGVWHSPATAVSPYNYQNGWGDYSDSAYGGAQYSHVGPFTVMKGLIAGGSWETIAFRLLPGYAPFRQFFLLCASATGAPRSLEITSSGDVFMESYGNVTNNAWASVACVFPTNA